MINPYDDIKAAIWETMPDRLAIALQYRKRHRRFPNLRNPRTLTEKVQYRKLYDRDPRLPIWADKVKVKPIIAGIIGEEHIIPTLWHGKVLDVEAVSQLPRPFVIKSNSACEANIFIHEGDEVDWIKVAYQTREWMHESYGTRMREWLYSAIDRQILVEPMIGDGHAPPVDYKFFIFHGEIHAVHVDIGRFTGGRVRAILDSEWNRLPVKCYHPNAPFDVARPPWFNAMKDIAEQIGRHFDFVRVDLYNVDGKIFFGEATFYPASGYLPYEPASFDAHLGSLWKMQS